MILAMLTMLAQAAEQEAALTSPDAWVFTAIVIGVAVVLGLVMGFGRSRGWW